MLLITAQAIRKVRRHFSKFLLVCGGDGSTTWVLGAIEANWPELRPASYADEDPAKLPTETVRLPSSAPPHQ